MIRSRKPSLAEASPHTPFGMFAGIFVRILLVGLLTVGLTLSSFAQARPPIEWMRGANAGSVRQIAISPDGFNVAVCGADGTTKIRRLSDGMLLETLVDSNTTITGFGTSPPTVTSLAYTSDGTQLLTGNSAAVVHLWDLASGAIVRSMTAPGAINALAITPGGTKFALGMTTNDILLFNFADFSSAGTLGGHTSAVTALAFTHDGTNNDANVKLASGGADSTVRIWKIAQSQLLNTLTQGKPVTSIAFGADDQTVCSGDNNAVIKIWNSSVISGAALSTINGTTNFNQQAVALAISPDGSHLAAGYLSADTKLHLWNISNPSSPVALPTADTTFPVVSVAFSHDPDGSQVYSTDAGNHINAWSGVNLAAQGTLAISFASTPRVVVPNPAGTVIATGTVGGAVQFWDPLTGTLLSSLVPAQGANLAQQITAITYSNDGATLAIAGYVPNGFNNPVGIVWIYNVPGSQVPDPVPLHLITLNATSLAFNQSGSLLAVGTGNNINVYQTSTLALQTVTGHTGAVNALASSPDGTVLASGSSDHNVKVWTWTASSLTLLKTLSKHTSVINSVAFSPDSTQLVDSSTDSTSILWHYVDATQIFTFTHTEMVNTAVFSRTGKQVITGSNDRHLKIWDAVNGGSPLRDFTLETGTPVSATPNGVTTCIYSPDGKFVFYGRNDNTLVASDNPLFVPLITGLSINPGSVVGGTTATGTVTLNSTTLAGGAVVSLSSDNTAVAAPAVTTVIVPQGSATATFTINTSGVGALSTANITASLNGSSATAPITVTTPTVLGLTISPTSVRGGQPSTGTVTLTGPAPGGGSIVTLTPSGSTNAIVPANVIVSAGATSATFTISTNVVATTNTATITATLGGSAQATLTITPPTVTALSTAPANLKGGQSSVGTVTISDPAPTGGIVVNISSNNTAAASSAVGSVTVAGGAKTATFNITTHPVSDVTSVTFTASFNGSSKTTVLTVTPPTVNSITLNPTSVKGGLTSTGTVTISDPAPTGGVVVNLSSANTAIATVPTTTTVPAGSTTGTFTATTSPVAVDTPVVLTATLEASTATATLTVQAPIVIAMTVNPTTVRAHQSAIVTVTLDGAAPTGGIAVNLFSSNTAVASLPATVTVAAGAKTATATVSTFSVSADTHITLAATLGTGNVSVTLTVVPHLPFDYNNDGHNDLILQNTVTNLVTIWYMNALTVTGASTVNTLPTKGYTVVGGVDFNNDGQTDLVFQNQTTGQVVLWYLNGVNLVGGEALSQSPNASYKVVGTGDFNGDGNVDLVFQNPGGAIVIWYLQGAKVIGGVTLPFTPAVGYNIVGVGDFNKDGQQDLLFQNVNTGQVVVWYMNGANFIGGGAISYLPPLAWKVKGVADYNNDGIPDIVFQNSSTNQVLTWFMNGLTVTGGDLITIQPAAPNKVVGPH
ncbi:MAG: hypothetical protein JWN14_5105 [Chthonomonadales bacterium]|nr:hypothetical protein [Chthonomonadales bacterium]